MHPFIQTQKTDSRLEPIMQLNINTFRLGTDKEAVLKPLEEAAEIYGAWQKYKEINEDTMPEFEEEIADCIQACVNLANRFNINVQDALDKVEAKNRSRGRIPEQNNETRNIPKLYVSISLRDIVSSCGCSRISELEEKLGLIATPSNSGSSFIQNQIEHELAEHLNKILDEEHYDVSTAAKRAADKYIEQTTN